MRHHYSLLFFVLLTVLFTGRPLAAQQVIVDVQITSVSSNYDNSDYQGPDIAWLGSGKIRFGNAGEQVLSSFCYYLENQDDPPHEVTRNENMATNLTFDLPSGYSLCDNPVELTIEFDGYENDGGGDCSYNDGDDDRRTATYTAQVGSFAPNVWNDRTVNLGNGLYVYNFRFRYRIESSIDNLSLVDESGSPVGNVLCESDANTGLRWQAENRGGLTSGLFQFQRKLKSSNSWSDWRLSSDGFTNVNTSLLRDYNFRVRHKGGSDFGLEDCLGNEELWTEQTGNFTIVPSIANGLMFDTEGTCPGFATPTGSITYPGVNSLSAGATIRLELTTADGDVFPGPLANHFANQPFTWEGLGRGSYTVTFTTNENTSGGVIAMCSGEVSNIRVSEFELPVITTADTDPDCFQTTGSIQVFLVSGGNGGTYTYTLTRINQDGSTTVQATLGPIFNGGGRFNNVPPGLYSVSTTSINGCSVFADGFVTISDQFPATADFEVVNQAGAFSVFCEGDSAPVIFRAPPGEGEYQISEFSDQFEPFTIPAGQSVTQMLPSGSYAVRFKRQGGCEAFEFVSVSVDPNQPFASVSSTVDPTACMPMSGSLTVEVTEGTPPYTYEITQTGASITTSALSHTFTSLAAGEYTVSVADDNGCTDLTFPTTLNAFSSLILTANPFAATCETDTDGRIELMASGGGGILMYRIDELDMTFGTATVFNDVLPGTYTATVMDTNGCQETVVIEVPVRQPLVINEVSINQPLCQGSEVIVEIQVTGRETEDNFPADFGFSCIDPNELFEISLDGGGTFFSATNWQDNFCSIEFPSFVNVDLVPGDYQIQIRDAINNCFSNVYTVTRADFNEPPPLIAEVTEVTDVTCRFAEDGSITLNLGGAFAGYQVNLYNFAVSTFIPEESYLVPEAGSFTIYNLPPSVNTSTVPGEYNGGYGFLIISGQSEIGGAFEGETGGASSVAKSLADNFNCVTPLPGSWNAENITPINIAEPDRLEIIGLDFDGQLNCDGTGGQVEITVQGGTPPYEYSLNGREYTTENILNDYSLLPSIEVRDANRCTAGEFYDDPFETVTTLDATAAQVSPAIACTGGTASVDITASTGPYIVTISQLIDEGTPRQIIREITTEETSILFEDIPSGSYDVFVQDAFTCLAIGGFSISMPEVYQVNTVTKTPESCVGNDDGTLSLLVTGGNPPYRTVFNGVEVEGQTRTITGLGSGDYTVLVFDANDCLVVLEDVIESATDIETIVTTAPTGPCLESSSGALGIRATGGTAPYTIVWDDDASLTQTLAEGQEASRTGLSSREWSFVLSDANGCSESFQRFVPGPDSMTIEVLNFVEPSCGVQGSFELDIAGGSGSYLVSLNGATPVASLSFTDLAAGDYNIMVTDNAGCVSQFMPTVTLTQEAEINTTATTNNLLCSGSGTGRINVVPPAGVTNVMYSLDGGTPQSSPVFGGLGGGTYTVEISSPFCSQTINGLTINEPAPLGLGTTLSDTDCATGLTTVTLQATGGDGDYSYGIDGLPADTPNTFEGVPSTSYSIEIQDGNGCFDFFDVLVPEYTTLQAGANASTPTACEDGNGTAAVTVVGGTPPYSFQWSDGGPADSLFTNVNSGDYTVTVTDANNCTFSETVTVGFVGPPTLNRVDLFTQGCDETRTGQINVRIDNPTAGFTYALNGGTPQSSPVFDGLMGGDYFVDIVSPFGCSLRVDNITLVLDDELTLDTEITPAPCGIGVTTLRLIASGGSGSDYSYGLDDNPPDTPDLYEVNPGQTYQVEVQDGNGCFRLFSVTIPESALLAITNVVSQDSECDPDTGQLAAEVTGGRPPYSFQWSNGGPADSLFTNVAAGTYEVTVTDADGCETISAPTTIIETQRPDFTAQTQDAGCGLSDGSTTITLTTGNLADFDFSWQAGVNSTINVATDLAAGNYAFTVTNRNNGCFRVGSSIVNSTDAPVLNLVPGSTVDARCDVPASGQARVLASEGSGSGYVYSWSSGEMGPRASQLVAGDNFVTVVDANECSATLTVVIDEAPSPTLSEQSNIPARCDVAASGMATVTVSGGVGPYSYRWSNGVTDPTATNLLAGDNSVTVTDGNGCTDELTVVITTAESPSLALESQTEAGCATAALASATVSVVGGNGPYEFLWSSTATTATADNLPAGDNTVTVTDVNGCTDELTVTILTADGPLLGLVSQSDAGCSTAASGGATVMASGGAPPYAYDWSSGETGETAVQLLAGDNTVTVTDANGCTAALTVTILEAASPTLSLDSQTEAGCDAVSLASATVSASGGSAPYSFSWSSGATDAMAMNLSPGESTVTVTDANGCTDELTVTIEQTPNPVISLLNQTDAGCSTDPIGSANVTATGGAEPYAFDWSSGETGTRATMLAVGDNTATVTDANGCTDELTVTILGAESPTISLLNQTIAGCGNQALAAATVFAAGGTPPYVFDWSSGATGVTANDLSAGVNTVTVTDGNSCTAELTVTIEQAPNPEISLLNQTEAGCSTASPASASVMATSGTAPYVFDWSNGETGPTAISLSTGLNVVTVTDARGCTAVLSFPVFEADAPTISIEAQSLAGCGTQSAASATVSATGGLPPYAFDWSSGESGPTAANLLVGNNTVTVTDANNCSATLTVTIEQAASPMASLGTLTPANCTEGTGAISIDVSGGTGTLTYVWSHDNALNGPMATNLFSGTYGLTVTDALGCSATVEGIVVDFNAAPTLSLTSVTPASCGENNGRIEVAVVGGSGVLTYSWTDNVSTGPVATDLAGGTYSVTVTDENGCLDVLSDIVEVETPPSLSLTSSSDALCGENVGRVAVAVTGGQAPFGFAWSHDNTLTTDVADNLPPGSYSVTVTDANNCLDVLSQLIDGSPAIVLESESTFSSTCGESNGTISVSLSGGTGTITYAWNHDAAETAANLTGLAAGLYSLIATDTRGCTYEQEYMVSNEDGPTINSTDVVDALCENGTGSITVNVTGGALPYVYSWSHDASLTGNSATSLENGDYEVIVRDQNNCEATANVTINFRPSPAMTLTGTDPECGLPNSGQVEITGVDPDVSVNWSDNGSGLVRTGLAAGIYSATVTDENGCTNEASVTLNPKTVPTLALENQEDVACAAALGSASFLIITISGPPTIEFSDAGVVPVVETLTGGNLRVSVGGLSAGNYELTVTDPSGCPAITSLTIDEEVPFQLNLEGTTSVSCNGETDGAATVVIAGSEDTFTFQWDIGANNQTGPDASNPAAGTYSVTATSSRGCTEMVMVDITQPDALLASEATNTAVTCFGEADGSLSVAVNGGTMPYTYRWRGDTLPAFANQTNLPAGEYQVVVTDARGCENMVNMTLSEPAQLEADAVVESSDCAETATGSITVTPTGGTAPYTFVWLEIPSLTTNQANDLAAGDYTIQVSDANNCIVELTESVSNASGTITLTVTEQVGVSCLEAADGSITVEASGDPGGFSYVWSSGDSGPTADGLTGGQDYIVTVTNSLGCTQTLTVSMANGPALEVLSVAADTTLCSGNFYVLDLSDYATVTINGPDGFFSNEAVSILEEAGDYEIMVTNAAGCNASFMTRLNLAAQSFTARMVLASDAVITQPLVVLEASFPEPDAVNWVIDESRVSLTRQDDNLYSFSFTEPGVYDIGLVASSGGCEDVVSKQVTIHADSTTIPGANLGAGEILSLEVSPNPTTGLFVVSAELSSAQAFSLALFRGSGERIERRRVDGQTTIVETFDLDLMPGTYFLQAQAGNERRMVPVVVQ